jgi:cyclophilin family peptidyl-prolyl cis-trans isomerase
MTFRRVSVALAAVLALAFAVGAQEKSAGVRAILELKDNFFYAGDPFPIRINIVNESDKTVPNPVKTAVTQGLELKVAGGAVLKPSGKPKASESSRPDKLGARGFYGAVADLAEIYPELRKPGRFEVRWTADGVSSDTIFVAVIPKYDPSKDYRARIDTDEGSFVVEFFRQNAPLATKSFIDLANAGFYDGLLLHEVRPDWFVGGGDPSGDGSGGAPLRYPAESSGIPVVAGTVLMKPAGAAPPANSSQFIIMLRPEPAWTGQFTVVGQVVEGLETVQKISRLPSTQQTSQPFFRPLKDVRTLKVTVTEKPVLAVPAGS